MRDPGPGRSITLQSVENTLQFRFNFRRQRNNGRIIDQPKNAGRIHEADADFAGRIFAHENIARQQQTDIGYCAYRLMCKDRTEALTTAAYAWETLVFDFSNEAFGTQAFNLAFTYNKASIFIQLWNQRRDGWWSQIILF